VFKVASETGDEATRGEVASFLHHCESILNREAQPDLNLAENIANFLYELLGSQRGRGQGHFGTFPTRFTTPSTATTPA
jgi:hypothetical protein